ncbi:hypothetical protein ACROYT_G015037 [Oculina patagonica]
MGYSPWLAVCRPESPQTRGVDCLETVAKCSFQCSHSRATLEWLEFMRYSCSGSEGMVLGAMQFCRRSLLQAEAIIMLSKGLNSGCFSNRRLKHIRRNLEAEFSEFLKFENLLDSTRVFLIPASLTPVQIARNVPTILMAEKENKGSTTKISNIQKAAADIRKAIRDQKSKMSWPPRPSELTDSAIDVPEELSAFLYTLLTGSKDSSETECCQRVQRLMKSFAQDLIFGVTRGQVKSPKQILPPYAVKTLTNSVELVSILNRYVHGISYSQLEEINTALCLQKMATTATSEVPLPSNTQPHVSTTLARDNIDRLEETLSGEALHNV